MLTRGTDTGNLPVLYRNVMDALPSDFARDVFLWASDRPGNDRMCYSAERLARKADRLARVITTLIDLSHYRKTGALDDERADDLKRFMLKRFLNHECGANLNPAFLEQDPKPC